MGANSSQQQPLSEHNVFQSYGNLKHKSKEPHPVVTAVLAEDTKQVEWLFSEGLASATTCTPQSEESLLLMACRLDSASIVKLLLEHGANPMDIGPGGRTVLHNCIIGMQRTAFKSGTTDASVLTQILCAVPPNHLRGILDHCSVDGVSVCHLALSFGLGKVLAELIETLPDAARLCTTSSTGETPVDCASRAVSTSVSVESEQHWKTFVRQRFFVEVGPAWWMTPTLLSTANLSKAIKAVETRVAGSANPDFCSTVLLTGQFVASYVPIEVSPDEFYLPPAPKKAFQIVVVPEMTAAVETLSDVVLRSPPGGSGLLGLLVKHTNLCREALDILGNVRGGTMLNYHDMFFLHRQLNSLLSVFQDVNRLPTLVVELLQTGCAEDSSLTSALNLAVARSQLWPFTQAPFDGPGPLDLIDNQDVRRSVVAAMVSSVMRGVVSEFGLNPHIEQFGGRVHISSPASPACFTDLTQKPAERGSLFLGNFKWELKKHVDGLNTCLSWSKTRFVDRTPEVVDYTANLLDVASSTLGIVCSAVAMMLPTGHPFHRWLSGVVAPPSEVAGATTFLSDVRRAVVEGRSAPAFKKIILQQTVRRLSPPTDHVIDVRRSTLRRRFLEHARLPDGPFRSEGMSNKNVIANSTQDIFEMCEDDPLEALPVVMSAHDIQTTDLLLRSAWNVCSVYPRHLATQICARHPDHFGDEEAPLTTFLPISLVGKSFVSVDLLVEPPSFSGQPNVNSLPLTAPDVRLPHMGIQCRHSTVSAVCGSVDRGHFQTNCSSLHMLSLGTKAIPMGPGSKTSASTFQQLRSRSAACHAELCIQSALFSQNDLFL